MSKIVHFQIIGGDQEDVKNLSMALNDMRKTTELDIEFLVTNENIQLRDVKWMIDELYKLYKANKALSEKK